MGCREFKHDTAELLRQGEEIMALRDAVHGARDRGRHGLARALHRCAGGGYVQGNAASTVG